MTNLDYNEAASKDADWGEWGWDAFCSECVQCKVGLKMRGRLRHKYGKIIAASDWLSGVTWMNELDTRKMAIW